MFDPLSILLGLAVMFAYGVSLIVQGIRQRTRRITNLCPTCLGWRRLAIMRNNGEASTEPCPTCCETGKIAP